MLILYNKEYDNFRELFEDVKNIKKTTRFKYVKGEKGIKKEFYNVPISEFRKDMIWRYVWDDISYEYLKKIMQM